MFTYILIIAISVARNINQLFKHDLHICILLLKKELIPSLKVKFYLRSRGPKAILSLQYFQLYNFTRICAAYFKTTKYETIKIYICKNFYFFILFFEI